MNPNYVHHKEEKREVQQINQLLFWGIRTYPTSTPKPLACVRTTKVIQRMPILVRKTIQTCFLPQTEDQPRGFAGIQTTAMPAFDRPVPHKPPPRLPGRVPAQRQLPALMPL